MKTTIQVNMITRDKLIMFKQKMKPAHRARDYDAVISLLLKFYRENNKLVESWK